MQTNIPSPFHSEPAPVWELVLHAVFGGSWVGQQRFTTTATLDAMIDGLALRPGMHVLDVQSGWGGPARYLARRTGCTVVGIEKNTGAVHKARHAAERQGVPVHSFAGDLNEPLFTDMSFDAIVARDTFFALENRLRRLTTYRNLLLPGGRLACTIVVASEDFAGRSISLPTRPECEYLADRAGLGIITLDNATDEFRAVCVRWVETLQHWHTELHHELSDREFAALHATIGRIAQWGMQGMAGQLHMVAARPDR